MSLSLFSTSLDLSVTSRFAATAFTEARVDRDLVSATKETRPEGTGDELLPFFL